MGHSTDEARRAPIHVFYSARTWVDASVTQQLEAYASLPGVKCIVAMPDLHPSRFGPIGCAMLAEQVHPQFIGGDIGCGMALFQLDISAASLEPEKTAGLLRTLDGAWDGDPVAVLAEAGLASNEFDAALGTVGGGNHFCEVQAIDEILEPEAAARAGLDGAFAYLLVHSGSRGLGYEVLQRQIAVDPGPLDPASEAGSAYLSAHDAALRWALLNRRVIAERASRAIGAGFRVIANLNHNSGERRADGILHRKGAAPADRGLVPIPGSRGTLTYLVEPLAADRPETLASLAHGAGRKYDRAAMQGIAEAVQPELGGLARNPFGGVVVCEDPDLLVEEAPDAYKAIDRVIADLIKFGLVRVVATFRPLVTFKTARRAT